MKASDILIADSNKILSNEFPFEAKVLADMLFSKYFKSKKFITAKEATELAIRDALNIEANENVYHLYKNEGESIGTLLRDKFFKMAHEGDYLE